MDVQPPVPQRFMQMVPPRHVACRRSAHLPEAQACYTHLTSHSCSFATAGGASSSLISKLPIQPLQQCHRPRAPSEQEGPFPVAASSSFTPEPLAASPCTATTQHSPGVVLLTMLRSELGLLPAAVPARHVDGILACQQQLPRGVVAAQAHLQQKGSTGYNSAACASPKHIVAGWRRTSAGHSVMQHRHSLLHAEV